MSKKPWLTQYDKGVSACLTYPDVCVHELLSRTAKEKNNQVAIEIGEKNITYGQLDTASTNFAVNLTNLGVKIGEVVGLCLANSIEFVIAFFGILKSGGIVAAMNPSFPMRELQFQVKNTGMKVVVTSSEKAVDFCGMNEEVEIRDLILIGNISSIDKPEKIHLISFDDFSKSGTSGGSLPSVRPTDPAVVQFSGGTTGTPKAALGSHSNLVANVTQFGNWLVNLEHGKETFLIAIPLYHVYGLVLGLILGVESLARMIFIEHPGNVDEILMAVKRYPVSYFPAVPSVFHKIYQHPDVANKKINLSTIKACISGSAPLLDSVRQEFEQNTGGFLVEGYGLSEAPTATHCNPILGIKCSGSIGLPLPDVDCKITSVQDDELELEAGEEGELWVRGPQVMIGYLNNPEENRVSIKDGWLRTGDIARMDKDGYFYLAGRRKDLIKVHGMQVWPTEVEEVISTHPAVLECTAAGIFDEKSGERVKIWVVLRPGKSLDLAEVIDFCHDKLAAYKIPSQMEVRENIPRTPVGKVLRRILLEEHNAKKN